MDKVLLRNFIIFVVILLVSSSTLGYVLLKGDIEVQRTDERVEHTHQVILEAEQVAAYIEGILASQRAFLLSGDQSFLNEYEEKKAALYENLARLSYLMADDAAQLQRIDEMERYLTGFSKILDERAKMIHPQIDAKFMENVQKVDEFRDNLIRINSAVLLNEYTALNQRIQGLEARKESYLKTLIAGLVISTILLLVLNGFLFYAQKKRSNMEAMLKSTEDRFSMAVEGTRDGIFDWDLVNGRYFYSGRFHEMLGYERRNTMGTAQDFKDLLHPDDARRVWDTVELYLQGGVSEYAQEFRMRHATGGWIWVHSKAKAIRDDKGRALRLVGANSDITHLKQAQHKLQDEKKRAEDANQAKSQFLAHMSHEIRTPLTVISGVAEILERRQDGLDDKQKQLIRTLGASSASLKDLISDILDFSKIESGELDLHNELIDLAGIFEGVISIMAERAQEKGLAFTFKYDALPDDAFYGDQIRLRQILINLVGNAVKFTDEGSVTINAGVEVRRGEKFLRVDVADTGLGIMPEDFDLIFERFKQADSSVSRKYGGTGLGLPISRNLARLMNGDIFVSSEPGNGATFTLLLPYKDPVFQTREKIYAQDFDKKLNERIKALLNDEMRVLIVEDYEGNVVVVGYMLDDLGLSYDVARTGVEALDLWKNNHYDIVLMDVQMPEMDGFTATREIRRLESERGLPRTPIIGMTAHALIGDKDKCIGAGMDAYLSKPLIEDDLKKEMLIFLEQAARDA